MLGSESENLCTHQVDTVFSSTVVIVVWLPRVPVGVGDLFKSVLPHIGALISLVSKAYPVGLAGGQETSQGGLNIVLFMRSSNGDY